jgi:23S rRNA G2445 N2-methylase RlmL
MIFLTYSSNSYFVDKSLVKRFCKTMWTSRFGTREHMLPVFKMIYKFVYKYKKIWIKNWHIHLNILRAHKLVSRKTNIVLCRVQKRKKMVKKLFGRLFFYTRHKNINLDVPEVHLRARVDRDGLTIYFDMSSKVNDWANIMLGRGGRNKLVYGK